MSGLLTELRESLAAVIAAAAGVPCSPVPPTRVSPDLAYLDSDEPYLNCEPGETVPFGHALVNFEVRLVVRPTGNNETDISRLDDLIELTVSALISERHTVLSVDQPVNLMTQSGSFTSAAIHISTVIAL